MKSSLYNRFTLLGGLCLFCFVSYSQKNNNVDSLYQASREMAFDSNRVNFLFKIYNTIRNNNNGEFPSEALDVLWEAQLLSESIDFKSVKFDFYDIMIRHIIKGGWTPDDQVEYLTLYLKESSRQPTA